MAKGCPDRAAFCLYELTRHCSEAVAVYSCRNAMNDPGRQSFIVRMQLTLQLKIIQIKFPAFRVMLVFS